MTDAELIDRIKAAALLHGDFTLRSGRRSRYYLDKYLFETQPDILTELGRRLAAHVKTWDSQTRVDRLAGAELGGIPLVAAASMAAHKPCVLIRNQKKNYGTAKQLEGTLEPHDRVLIVEDIATTGGQVLEAARTLTDAGAEVAGIVAVIDRREGAREKIEAAGYAFSSLLTRADLGVEERG